MKRTAVLLAGLMLLAATSEAQFKQKVTPRQTQYLRSGMMTPMLDTTLVGASTFTLGWVSSASTFTNQKGFYGGTLEYIRGFEDSSYINIWSTLPGTDNNETFGLSYGKLIPTPHIENLNLFFNAGVLYSAASDSLSNNRNWVGVPIGVRATYQLFQGIGLGAVFDVVPAYNVLRVSTEPSRFGITFMFKGSLSLTP